MWVPRIGKIYASSSSQSPSIPSKVVPSILFARVALSDIAQLNPTLTCAPWVAVLGRGLICRVDERHRISVETTWISSKKQIILLTYRDPPPKNFLSPKSHILDSNGVWYSSFWLEGPKNHRNLKNLVSNFVPRGFEARRTWGFEAQRDGVWRGGAMGFRGAAPL